MSYSLAYTQAIALMISIGAQNLFKGMEWVSAGFLSESLSVPRPTVVNILSRLLAAGLLESKEGNRGGVCLGRPAERITLLDIFEAIERKRPLFRLDMTVRNDTDEVRASRHKVAESFEAAETNMRNTLAEVRLDSLFSCD